ncbi:MAG TPA: hypothetical protein VH682_03995 [Gemmataceae bacterium]|jgi:hypothetical protein
MAKKGSIARREFLTRATATPAAATDLTAEVLLATYRSAKDGERFDSPGAEW